MTAVTSTSGPAPGGCQAPGDAEAAATSSTAPSLQSRLERLQELDGSALRDEWRRVCRSDPPRISRDLLLRALAYRVQELEFGGLPKWARQTLAGSAALTDRPEAAETPKPTLPRLKPGARLVREWHGRIHSVFVLEDAFQFEGRRFRSLTQVAREITGAHWSGPRFFGLVKRKARTALDAVPMRQDDLGQIRGLLPPGPGASSLEPQRDVVGAAGPDARRCGQRVEDGAHG